MEGGGSGKRERQEVKGEERREEEKEGGGRREREKQGVNGEGKGKRLGGGGRAWLRGEGLGREGKRGEGGGSGREEAGTDSVMALTRLTESVMSLSFFPFYISINFSFVSLAFFLN